jgi:2'-5' RNA ligase
MTMRNHRPARSYHDTKNTVQHGDSIPRLFFAVFVPNDLRPALEAAQKKLVGKWWKPVHRDQFHVTLLFLGTVKDEQLGAVRRAGRELAFNTSPFTATIRGTGFFPNEGNPRVWFAKLEADTLETMHATLRAALRTEVEEKFHAHVTLARKKGSSPRPPPIVFDQAFPVTQFSLVKSTLSKAGPHYQILETFALKKP